MSKLAYHISNFFSANLVSVYLLIPVSLNSNTSLYITIPVGILLMGILPIILILYDSRKEEIDIFVSDRRKRTKYFLVAIFSYAIGSIFFYYVVYDSLQFNYYLAYFAVTTFDMLVTLRWKISVHVSGVAGPVTFLVMKISNIYAILYIILIPVAWARYSLRAHTKWQLLGGALSAPLVTYVSVNYIAPLCGVY